MWWRLSISHLLKACLFAVKTDLVQTIFLAMGLVFLAALQDMLPQFGGTKAPLLQVFALYMVFAEPLDGKSRDRRTDGSARWLVTAGAAGFLLEALSGFPLGCCIGFLLAACALARALRQIAVASLSPVVLGAVVAMVFSLLQEVWLDAWGVTGGGPALVRFFAGILLAAVTGATLFAILPRLERFAGLREEVAP